MNERLLYTPSEVAAFMEKGNVVLIDIRNPEHYIKAHIPGAVNIPEIFSCLAETTPSGLNAMHKKFQKIFSKAGVSYDKKAIVYEDRLDSQYGGSCRGCWLLLYLGHPCPGIINGGMSAWLEHGFPVENGKVMPESACFDLNPKAFLMATKDDMLKAIYDPAIVLLDDRDEIEWKGMSSSPYGIDFAPRKGRIPGARWIEWYEFMDKNASAPLFKQKEEIRAVCAENGVYPDDDIIIYCFKGSRAANTYIALKTAGFRKLRIYFGSWNEWSRDLSLPIEEGA
ncbi:MAG: sulfurtransferase [Pseudomonadota bacterium]